MDYQILKKKKKKKKWAGLQDWKQIVQGQSAQKIFGWKKKCKGRIAQPHPPQISNGQSLTTTTTHCILPLKLKAIFMSVISSKFPRYWRAK